MAFGRPCATEMATPTRPTVPGGVDAPPAATSSRHHVGVDTPLDIRPLTRADAHWHLDGLAALLLDGVHAGASLGHLLPLSRDDAERDWSALQVQLSDDELLWIARRGEELVGCVRLRLAGAAGDRHRAAVERLVVASAHRRQGTATALLAAVEHEALERGLRLLVADVEAGAEAGRRFAHLGWETAGTIPGYLSAPDGTPRDATRLFRRLDRPAFTF